MPKINFSVTGDEWEYDYDGNKIVVKNSWDGTKLIVNDKLQDCKNGITMSADLRGKLPDGKKIKASLGGVWNVKCSLFVDHELLEPVKKD